MALHVSDTVLPDSKFLKSTTDIQYYILLPCLKYEISKLYTYQFPEVLLLVRHLSSKGELSLSTS